ncbi:ketoacyl-ACP synthase III [Nocardiopsis oceani]
MAFDALSGSRVLAFGGYRPETVLTNAELAARIDTTDEWIQSRVGIRERRIAGATESLVDMAVQAGDKALAAGGTAPSEINLVIVATCTMESSIPQAAAQVAARLGIPSPGAFDINSACSGFTYALAAASDFVRCGSARRVLIIGAEKMSQWIDWNDRSTCVLFADGAGAAVVGPSERIGIGPVVWGSDGASADALRIPDRNSFLQQDGRAVFRWVKSLSENARTACERAGVAPSDLTAFVPHQANLRLIELVAEQLGLRDVVIARDVETAGNTTAASIPLALISLIEQGQVPSGGHALLFGFGAGLSYACTVIETPSWPPQPQSKE